MLLRINPCQNYYPCNYSIKLKLPQRQYEKLQYLILEVKGKIERYQLKIIRFIIFLCPRSCQHPNKFHFKIIFFSFDLSGNWLFHIFDYSAWIYVTYNQKQYHQMVFELTKEHQLLKETIIHHLLLRSKLDSTLIEMQGITGRQFVESIARHLQYLHNHLQKAISLKDISLSQPQFVEQAKPERDPFIDQLDILKRQITQCKKQKIRKQHELSNKPKKPVSSFVFYFREQLRNRNHPSNQKQVGKLAKILSVEWKQLPLEAKWPYYQKALQSKQTYKQNMKIFKFEHTQEIQQIDKLKKMANNKIRRLKRKKQGNNMSTPKRRRTKRRKSRKGLPDNGIPRPKCPISSFFAFFKENTSRISEQNKENRRSRLVQIASQEWKQLNKKQKERYESISKASKKIYEKQIQDYTIRSKLLQEQKKYLLQSQGNKFQDKLKQKRRSSKIPSQGSKLIKKQQPERDNSKDAPEIIDNIDIDSLGSPSDTQSSLCNQSFSSSQSYIQNNTINNSSEMTRQLIQKDQFFKKSEDAEMMVKRRSKWGKKHKSEHKPKGTGSSFFLYYNCIVRQLKKEFPQLKGSQLPAIASQRWSLFTEQQKEIYREQAKRGRQLHQLEMQKFQKQYPEQAAKLKLLKRKRGK